MAGSSPTARTNPVQFDIYVQPFPDTVAGQMESVWRRRRGAALEPRRQGAVLLRRADAHDGAGQRSRPTFSNGAPVVLFAAAPSRPGYTNDSHRWQIAPDGKRFLLLHPAGGEQQAPPLDVVVNWTTLLKE